MVGPALQRFAILLMLFGGFAQIIDLLTLMSGGYWGGVERALIYIALFVGLSGMVIEMVRE